MQNRQGLYYNKCIKNLLHFFFWGFFCQHIHLFKVAPPPHMTFMLNLHTQTHNIHPNIRPPLPSSDHLYLHHTIIKF